MRVLGSIFFLGALIPDAAARNYLKGRGSMRLLDYTPSSIGSLHNEVVMQVHDQMLLTPPQNSDEYSNLVLNEMLTLCDEYDRDCIDSVHAVLHKAESDIRGQPDDCDSFQIQNILPENFDGDVKKYFEEIQEAVCSLQDEPLEKVTSKLDSISEKAEQSGLDENKVAAIQAVASVGKSSSEMWVSARSDPKNVFFKIHDAARRKSLDDSYENKQRYAKYSLLKRPENIALLDVAGAMKGAVETVLLPWAGPFGIISSAIVFSLEGVGIFIPDGLDIALCVVGAVFEIGPADKCELISLLNIWEENESFWWAADNLWMALAEFLADWW